MKADILKELNIARYRREAVALVTDIATGNQRLVKQNELSADPLHTAIQQRFRSGKSGMVETNPDTVAGEQFIAVYAPPPRMVIIGAVHISQALAPLARSCQFDVTVIDPRTSFASSERFEGSKPLAQWPADVLKEAPLDAYTALVAVTHDPKIDDLPLQQALEQGCFYVGALGSRKTHGKRVERLSAAGVNAELIERIHAPIGLDIGAATPSEIAVAIMAQVIEELRKGNVLSRDSTA